MASSSSEEGSGAPENFQISDICNEQRQVTDTDDDDHQHQHRQYVNMCVTVEENDEDEDMTIDCLNPPRMVKKSNAIQRNQRQPSTDQETVHPLAVTTIECQCCRTQQRYFHCQECVRSGLIVRRNRQSEGVR